MPVRSAVYIDGFNLYYGAVKDTRFKWLNLQKYFEMVRSDDDIQIIHYFTALIDGPHLANQEAFLAALATSSKINIVLGRYMRKPMKCRVSACSHSGSRTFARPEEKQTDVNIGLQMLDDAYQGVAERFVLVSGDSDLVPAINIVKTRFPQIEIVVYVPNNNPDRGAAVELRAAADKHRNLPLQPLARAQFPEEVRGVGTTVIRKPTGW